MRRTDFSLTHATAALILGLGLAACARHESPSEATNQTPNKDYAFPVPSQFPGVTDRPDAGPNPSVATENAPGARSADLDLQRRIQEQMSADGRLTHSAIDVSVKDGVATLSGMVNLHDDAEKAKAIARAAGASDVVNLLSVRYGPGETPNK